MGQKAIDVTIGEGYEMKAVTLAEAEQENRRLREIIRVLSRSRNRTAVLVEHTGVPVEESVQWRVVICAPTLDEASVANAIRGALHSASEAWWAAAAEIHAAAAGEQ